MRLSEAVILYLTIAAPFGAAFFVRRHAASSSRPRAFASAAFVALTWPAAAFLMLKAKTQGGALRKSGTDGDAAHCPSASGGRVERAQRSLAAALVRVEELFESFSGSRNEKVRHALFAARRSVERFAGLVLATEGVSAEAPPTARELELYRVAGLADEDLMLAGRCAHRRNALRLLLHRERARKEMLHALSEVRETACGISRATLTTAGGPAARQLSEAIARAYELALELFSTLNDQRAVDGVARLLDAERGRLRRLGEQVNEMACREGATEGELCTIPAAAIASVPRHRPWTQTSARD